MRAVWRHGLEERMKPSTASIPVSDLRARLRARYAPPAYVYFEEVRDATGFFSLRTADSVAMGVWPSRGLLLEGFEIKASRSDWRRELKNPKKGEGVLSYCDRVWVVTTSRGLVHDEEVPPLWGIIEPRGNGLAMRREAKVNPDRHELDRLFFASLMRQAHRWLEHELKNADRTVEAQEKGFKEGKRIGERGLELAEEQLGSLRRQIIAFEKQSGVKIDSWYLGDIGAAVKMVLRSDHVGIRRDLERMRRQISLILDETEPPQGGPSCKPAAGAESSTSPETTSSRGIRRPTT